MGSGCVICSKIVVYVFVFCQLAVGAFLLVYSSSDEGLKRAGYTTWGFIGGTVYLILGTLLLVGSIRENEKCILVYLIISTPFLIFASIRLFIFLFGFKLPIVYIFLIFLVFLIVWSMQYAVCVFCKYLVNIEKKYNSAGNNGALNNVVTIPAEQQQTEFVVKRIYPDLPESRNY